MELLDEFWKILLAHFEKTNSDFTIKHWIMPAKLLKIDQNYLYIQVPSQTYANFWEDNLLTDVMERGYDFFRKSFEPKFMISDEQDFSAKPAIMESTPQIHTIEETKEVTQNIYLEDDSLLNPKYTFDSFIIGKGNQMAHAAALVVCERPGQLYNPLFFYGGVGLGKTHLMQAIGNQYKLLNPNARVKYVTSEAFTNEMITSLRTNTQQEFRDYYRNVDLLLVDDIQFFAEKEATQEEFFHTFNALFNNQKQIVLTSDRQPTEIKALQERLVSRFVSGLPVDITPPDLETRIAILSKKSETVGIDISVDTLSYIAGQIQSNVRELEGALVRVQAYSVTHGEDITTNLAAEALQNFLPGSKEKIVSVQDIQEAVARYYHISLEDLKGKKRTKSIVEPRQIAMYLARELTNSSLPKLGTEFGKDHSTVLHAYDKINEEYKLQGDVTKAVNDLKKKLGF